MALADRIPELIREGRAEAGLTQRLLAERVGVDQSTVSLWERGKERPSLEQADLVFESLGLVIQIDRRRPSSTTDEGVDRAQIFAVLDAHEADYVLIGGGWPPRSKARH